MIQNQWFKVFPGSITVTDQNATILEMNDLAVEAYKDGGGIELIGKSVISCHHEPTRSQVKKMYDAPSPNVYFLVENGKRELVYHAPYYVDGHFAGLVELCFEVPENIPEITHE